MAREYPVLGLFRAVEQGGEVAVIPNPAIFERLLRETIIEVYETVAELLRRDAAQLRNPDAPSPRVQ